MIVAPTTVTPAVSENADGTLQIVIGPQTFRCIDRGQLDAIGAGNFQLPLILAQMWLACMGATPPVDPATATFAELQAAMQQPLRVVQ